MTIQLTLEEYSKQKSADYVFNTMVGDTEEFNIFLLHLTTPEKIMNIKFKHKVTGCMVIKKNLFNFKLNIDALEEFKENNLFFETKNSIYLRWLSEKSHGVSDSAGYIHFLFTTFDYVIEVIANYEPQISITDSSKKQKE